MPPKRIPPEQRFWGFVDKGEPDECWEWKGNSHPTGYGKFWEATGRCMHTVSHMLWRMA